MMELTKVVFEKKEESEDVEVVVLPGKFLNYLSIKYRAGDVLKMPSDIAKNLELEKQIKIKGA